MGYWTALSGNRYNVNIDDDVIKAMQKVGARFCFMDDTPGIIDEANETFYETKQDDATNDTTDDTTDDTTGDTTDDTTGDTTDDTNEPHRSLREGITVVTENGEQVTGYVVHWVRNYNYETPGTDIQNWFIFQPGTYPTHYIIKRPNHPNSEIVITDL